MGGKDPGQKLKKADNDAPTPKPSTALKRAKREPNGHWVCADFASLKIWDICWESCLGQRHREGNRADARV